MKQNKKTLEYLKKGYKAVEISKITGVQINTHYKNQKVGYEVYRLMLVKKKAIPTKNSRIA